MEDFYESFDHYGIKGMKWGKHKYKATKPGPNKTTVTKDSYGNVIFNYGPSTIKTDQYGNKLGGFSNEKSKTEIEKGYFNKDTGERWVKNKNTRFPQAERTYMSINVKKGQISFKNNSKMKKVMSSRIKGSKVKSLIMTGKNKTRQFIKSLKK